MPTLQLSTSNPLPLHNAMTGTPVTISNQDVTNVVLIGDELGLFAAQNAVGGGAFTYPNITVLLPGQAFTFTDGIELYGLAVTGTPTVSIAEGTTSTAGALSGTSMVSASSLLNPTTIYHVSAAGNTLISPMLLNQNGYELQLKINVNPSSTVPFLDMFIMWSDSVSNQVVAEEEWVLAAGPTGSGNVYSIKGPTKGDTISFNLVNLDPTFIINAQLTLLINSRQWLRDRIYTLSYTAPPGFAIANTRGFTDVIASVDNLTVHPGTKQILFPPYAGDVWLWVDQQGNTSANANFFLQVAPTSVFGTAAFFGANPSSGPPTGSGAVTRFPRGHVLMTYTNGGSVDSTVNCKVIALDERN